MRACWYLGAFLALCAVPAVAAAALVAPTTPLRLGQTDTGVLALQQILNTSADTAVAAAGHGAPGQETTYFGAKTLDAVKRFQAKHNLPTTGYVGPLTLAALKGLTGAPAATPTPPGVASTSPQTTTAPVSTPAFVPGTVVDGYVAAMRSAGTKAGATAQELDAAEAQIRATATSTAATDAFYAKQRALFNKKHALLNAVMDHIVKVFAPEVALADTGLPFGGFIAYVNPLCTCSPNVQQLFITLPQPTPTSNMLLDYVDGTEAFEWYNLPEPGLATLGEYTPAAQSCYFIVPHVGCYPIYAQGTIQPIVGSSPVPTI